MQNIVIHCIEQYHLLPKQATVVVAFSGGADSLCLLHLLHQLCGPGQSYPGIQLHVAHLNHQLRGAVSDQDALVVAQLAQSWHLPYTIATLDVRALAHREGRSLEEAARIARYQFLRTVAQGQPIAVAHHMDDQVETLLLHWLRGGGLASMAGLQPRQQDIIRPLLHITHADTLAYCTQHQLTPLEDASNTDPHFLRNRIRHELIPLLETLNPGIRETLLRNAEVMHVDFAWLEEQVDMHWSHIVNNERAEAAIQVAIQPLLALSLSLQRHLLRRVTAHLCMGQSPLELRHYRLLEELMQRERTGEKITLDLPQQLQVARVQNTLTFALRNGQNSHAKFFQQDNTAAKLPIPGSVVVPGTGWTAVADLLPDMLQQQALYALHNNNWTKVWQLLPSTPYCVYIDADRLLAHPQDNLAAQAAHLYVRTRQPGDRIQPLGMAHEKKVQDVLVDKHIPRAERAHIPLFFSHTYCVWLAGIHLDERVRLTHKTQHIVRLSIIYTE